MMGRYFVTATDTEVGKTYVSAHYLKKYQQQGYRTLGLKPVASGTIQGVNEDALSLQHASSIKLPLNVINPFCFDAFCAPHIASRETNTLINSSGILHAIESPLSLEYDLCLIEGAGGWSVPINEKEMWVDFVRKLDVAVIIVVGMRLGCINHALLTERAIIDDGIPIKGWVANMIQPNMSMFKENLDTLKSHLTAPLLDVIPYDEQNACHMPLSFHNARF